MKQNAQKYDYNLNTFLKADDISYYLLGAFITDGCVYLSHNKYTYVSLSSKDRDWLEIITSHICENIPITKKKNSNCFNIDINDQQIAQWLISNNCVINKSLIVKMPQIPKQYLPDFLRGCVDGDGSIILAWAYYPNHKLSMPRKFLKCQKLFNYYGAESRI